MLRCCQKVLLVFDSLKHHGLQPARLLCHSIFQAGTLEWVAKSSKDITKRKRTSRLGDVIAPHKTKNLYPKID